MKYVDRIEEDVEKEVGEKVDGEIKKLLDKDRIEKSQNKIFGIPHPSAPPKKEESTE